MKNNMDTIFKSDDLLLTAFLLTQGIEFLDFTEDFPHHFVFHLSNPIKCLELKKQYLNNASAPARELFAKRAMLINEIKKSKNMVFSQRTD